MSTEQCRRLREAYLYARSRRKTKVIVLMGGSDFFSNGIHLNVIEAADDPAAESWRNLRAIDDVVREIVETESHLVISALSGDAAAGGVPFALAADRVAREDVVLNPYYGAHGRSLRVRVLDLPAAAPRRRELTARLTGPPFTPLGTARPSRSGCWTRRSAQPRRASTTRSVPSPCDWPQTRPEPPTRRKRRRRARDERSSRSSLPSRGTGPCVRCFFGDDHSYHEARQRFVHKLGAPCAVAPSAIAPADPLVRPAGRAA